MLVLMGVVFQYFTNLFFLVIYLKQVRGDQAFKHWLSYNPKSAGTIAGFSFLVNFKISRLFYSRLFGKDECNAPLEEPGIFYRPFNLCCLFNLLT